MPTSHSEEMQLVKSAQQNLHSFARIYEKYFDKIYKFFHYRIRIQTDSEDLTSQTFEKAIKNLHSFNDQGFPFSTWLFRIAHNTLIDYFREKGRHQNDCLHELLPSQEPSVELDHSLIDNQNAIEKVKEIISTLPQLHQEIWNLKLNADMSNKDIAETLNINQNHVNVTMHRSLQVIKNKLKRYQF